MAARLASSWGSPDQITQGKKACSFYRDSENQAVAADVEGKCRAFRWSYAVKGMNNPLVVGAAASIAGHNYFATVSNTTARRIGPGARR